MVEAIKTNSMNEEELMKQYADAGVDVSDLKPAEKADEKAEAPAEEKADEEEAKEHLQTKPEEPRKRSIYDEYKEKKNELKSEREQREALEQENRELQSKIEALNRADTPRERAEAEDELEEFAKEINADPQAIKKMRELFLKDIQVPTIDESLRKDLDEFKRYKAENQQAMEKTLFEKEFSKVTPTLKEFFPSVSDAELDTIKTEVDKIAHSKGWHDKDLDYIVFKNKDILSNFVSPHKKGMESKSRKDVSVDSFNFDPNADYSKLSPTEKVQWENEYRKMVSSSNELMTDANGRKIII